MSVPLLIGGATTSRQHTAVKIAPEYSEQAVLHVVDASKAVDVVARLLDPSARAKLTQENRAEQERLRLQYSALKRRPLVPWPEAASRRLALEWTTSTIAVPAFTGTRVLDVALEDIVPYIDWTFFFAAWELKGRFPAILEHPQYGHAARELFDNARTLLDRIVTEKSIHARAVYGFWPVNADGDDVVVHDPERDARSELSRFPMLRQQEQMAEGIPHLSLADFIAPRHTHGGPSDWIFGKFFCVFERKLWIAGVVRTYDKRKRRVC